MAKATIKAPENIAQLTKSSSTTISLPPSTLNIGPFQHRTTVALTLNTSVVGVSGLDSTISVFNAMKLYYVYAVEASGGIALIASTNSSLPSGFLSARLVGHLSLNSSGQVIHVYYYGQYDQESLQTKPNLLINGNFDYWQRGTTFSNTVNLYTADRWYLWHQLSTLTRLASDLSGSQYFVRWWNVSGTGESNLLQAVEEKIVAKVIGKKLTLSFWARKGPLTTGNINIYIGYNTSNDTKVPQAAELTGGGAVTVTSQVGTNWTKVFVTTANEVPTTAKGITVSITHQGMTLFGANDYIDLTQVELHEGHVSTPFQTAGNDLAGELELCQRFYEKTYRYDVVPGTTNQNSAGAVQDRWSSNPGSSDEFVFRWWFKVTKRAIPSIVGYNPQTGAIGSCWRDSSASINVQVQASGTSEYGTAMTNSSPSDTSVHRLHMTAECEL